MVCSLLKQKFFTTDFFSHEYFQPLTFPKLWYLRDLTMLVLKPTLIASQLFQLYSSVNLKFTVRLQDTFVAAKSSLFWLCHCLSINVISLCSIIIYNLFVLIEQNF